MTAGWLLDSWTASTGASPDLQSYDVVLYPRNPGRDPDVYREIDESCLVW